MIDDLFFRETFYRRVTSELNPQIVPTSAAYWSVGVIASRLKVMFIQTRGVPATCKTPNQTDYKT